MVIERTPENELFTQEIKGNSKANKDLYLLYQNKLEIGYKNII